MLFENCRVQAKSVVQFLDKYYKNRRFRGRGEEYASVLIASHTARFAEYGFTIISRHDSKTGEVVAYFG
ncbi:unnamed protein product [marine sediment metagenome]|uniref:Uncharacterized protein n=1 Tax=marine sediment metagenome TaxID=412755 RepID=X1A6M9_9ZZZZ